MLHTVFVALFVLESLDKSMRFGVVLIRTQGADAKRGGADAEMTPEHLTC